MDDTREFKINLAADPAEENDSPPPAPQKPSSPVKRTWLWILAAAAALMILVAGGLYHVLNAKIQAINARGSAGIANLSEETGAKLDAFSILITEQTAQYEQREKELDQRLKAIDATIAGLQSGKPDKKEMAAAIARLSDDLKPMHQSMTAWDEKWGKMSEEARLLNDAMARTKAQLEAIQKTIEKFPETFVNQEQLSEKIKAEREFNQQNMAHATETLFSEIATLNQRILDLEKQLEDLIRSQKAAAQKLPSLDHVIPKPGEIVEQEIPSPGKVQP